MKRIITFIFSIILSLGMVFSFTGCQHPGLYTVSFDSDGGSVVQNQYLENGQFASVPINPTKDGYVFVYWLDTATNEGFNFNNQKITKNVTLKAIWLSTEGLDNYLYQFYDTNTLAILNVAEKSISELYFPDSVALIDRLVFENCNYLTKIVFNKTSKFQVFSYEAFKNCPNLESVVIPKSTVLIEGFAFFGCNKLSKVYYGGTEVQWNTLKVFKQTQKEDETYTFSGIVADGNEKLLNATVYYYSASRPTKNGNYWYYDSGEPTPW